MTTNIKYNYTGDFTLGKIELESNDGVVIDLIPLFVELNIFESIFNNTMSGNVVINDGLGLYDSLSLSGGEKIHISFYTSGKPESILEQTFIVFSQNNITDYNTTSYLYTLNFVSPEEYTDKLSIVKESYSGTISDITEIIFKKLNSKKNIKIENTKFLNDFIFPFWSPIKSINWLSKKAISTELNKTGFLFFENREGFNFVSIQSLYQNNSDVEFFYSPNTELTINNYTNYKLNEPNFLLEKLDKGLLHSRINTYDILNREISFNDKNYFNTFNKNKSLDLNSIPIPIEINDNTTNSIFLLKNSNSTKNNDYKEEYLFNYNSITNQINNNSVTIQIPGNTDLTVGYTAKCKILKSAHSDSIKYSNVNYNNMLISEIKHTIKEDMYYQTVTLTKDSYGITND